MLTCVVLAPLDRQIDPQLFAALAERGWTPRIEHDPRMAMAEACLVRREIQMRAAWQQASGQTPGIILATAEPRGTIDAMQASMARHVPDIPVWSARGDALEPLNEIARKSLQHEHQATQPEADSTAQQEAPALVFHPGIEGSDPEPLSREEMSMLLHDPPQPPADPEKP
jgi:hypothetical protein